MASFSSRQRLRHGRAVPELRPEFMSLLVQATARTTTSNNNNHNHQQHHHHQHHLNHLNHLQQLNQQQQQKGAAPRGTEHLAARRESMNLPESDCMRLNPSLRGIAFRSLVAVDLSASRGLVAWCGSRQMLRVLGLTGHGAAWVGGTAYCLWQSDSAAGREVLLNLLLALIFDIVVAVTIKGLVRRKGPSYCDPAAPHHPPQRGAPSSPFASSSPFSSAVSLAASAPPAPYYSSSASPTFYAGAGGRNPAGAAAPSAPSRLLPPLLRRALEASAFSFPANQATRAALLVLFLPRHLVLGFPLRVLLLLWALLVGLLRVALGHHYVTDVLCGFAVGCAEARLVEALWVSAAGFQALARAVGLPV
ncbi:inactive phospholipid phosphatase 7-like [Lethenteron reissneri]|uniref:inactive phospholipid phosphatase 7-like n=1 Tax=Lethenteron reissneri TaxID=7753 RepID=UPI002AB6FD65|nr:inactive phospholipid phosphatase 7-like [Lethenteron reissneri]